MRILKLHIKLWMAALLSIALFGCQEEELVKPHALLSESSLTFEAIDAEPQLLTIASDENWIVDAPDWITVDPISGSNTVEVTVSVTNNVDSKGVLAAPRQGVITIASTRDGYSVETVIYQKGDTYLGINEFTVTEVAEDLKDEEKAKISDAQVVAVSSNGFVISDGTTNMYVSGAKDVAVGDILYLNGSKATVNGLPVFMGDEVTVLYNSDVDYPGAEDITATLDKYTSDKITYVSVSGTLVASALKNIPGSPARGVTVFEAHESIGLADANVHKVVLTGYYVGVVGGNVNIIVTSIKDNGEDENIGTDFPFRDDFSWLDEYIAAANAVLAEKNHISDCVGNTIISADGAANIYTTLVNNNIPVLEQLRARGYTDLNPDMQTIYMQDAYFKFGATDKQSGLILPLMKMEGEQDIQVSFRWCCHLSGAENVDDVKLVVEIDGPGTVVTKAGTSDAKISDEITSTQQKGQMFWMDASVKITGATKATFITIRPNPIGSSDNKVTGVHRYYLDDIQVIPASAAVPATITVEGVEDNLITFEGAPDGPFSFDVTSDMDYTISSSAKWITLDVTEGLANEKKTVTVTCDPSELSVLRKGSISIKSGTSTYTIQVVQSAAGSEIAPFVSLSTGNSITVLGEGEEFSAKVQSNVYYQVEISDSWISEVEIPSSKAIVEVTEHAFNAAPNLTGVTRTGRIRFYNDANNIETILTVKQDAFIPRITVTPDYNIYLGVTGEGTTMNFNIDANIPYTVSTDASWVKLPASEGMSGVYQIPVTFEANATSAQRTAKVKFVNADYEYELEQEISQYPSGILFKDDFSWIAPILKELDPDGTKNYDTVGTHDLSAEAPNVYSTAAIKAAFVPLRDAIGYIIPGKDDGANNVLYLQDCYLKMGKTSTSSQTSLTLPTFDPAGKSCEISFDWARMEQGSGAIDNYTMTLMITGNGTFENGTKYSEELATPQQKGEMFWTNFSVNVSGADKDTRITFVATDLLDKTTGKIDYTKSGGKRMFIDNIVIKAK